MKSGGYISDVQHAVLHRRLLLEFGDAAAAQRAERRRHRGPAALPIIRAGEVQGALQAQRVAAGRDDNFVAAIEAHRAACGSQQV